MRIIIDGHIQVLNTEQVAEFALSLRYHFDGIVHAFEKYGPVRVRGPSAEDNLRVAQMLNRQLVTRAILDNLGIRVHARGLFLIAVTNRDQLENMAMLHTLNNANEKIHAPGSELRH
jgi:hypothetical protein